MTRSRSRRGEKTPAERSEYFVTHVRGDLEFPSTAPEPEPRSVVDVDSTDTTPGGRGPEPTAGESQSVSAPRIGNPWYQSSLFVAFAVLVFGAVFTWAWHLSHQVGETRVEVQSLAGNQVQLGEDLRSLGREVAEDRRRLEDKIETVEQRINSRLEGRIRTAPTEPAQ
jgi:hypothetical protein